MTKKLTEIQAMRILKGALFEFNRGHFASSLEFLVDTLEERELPEGYSPIFSNAANIVANTELQIGDMTNKQYLEFLDRAAESFQLFQFAPRKFEVWY